MNKVLPWLKAHWPIPALSVVAIAALPTAMYFASQMHDKFKASYQTSLTNDYNSVTSGAAQIKYGFPAWDGNGNVLEKTAPANEEMIKSYKTILEDLHSKVGVVSDKGIAFNKGEHKPIMDGVFPAPADPNSAQNLGRVFVSKYIDFHRQLLASMRAGEPPKADDIAAQLNEHSNSEIARIKAERGTDPNADDLARLGKELLAMRLSAVRRRASEIGVYADPGVFEGLPTSVPERAPTPGQEWDMQERAWIDQDICHAIALANGATTPVTQSVVKRVLKVAIRPPTWDPGNPSPATYDAGEDKVTLNFSVSLTGRTSGPNSHNKWYDVRPVTLELIVSSQNLPKFLDALAATNFMTVLDLDISGADPLADLRAGYDYGDEHVVKVTMLVETVWLREWRKPQMPDEVQKALAMVEGVDAGTMGSAPAPAAPVARPPNAGGNRPGGRRPRDGG
ncbi:MAG TPA: hypothetical protein VHC70_10365 [Phycisphaerales bacterium]|jgi:hypothetical protein|nr:hypothetical protein [Phycisphaerales bacterium]